MPGYRAFVSILVVLTVGCAIAQSEWRSPAPLGLDEFLPTPEGRPIREGEVELGRQLFFDARLSSNSSIRCASCHQPERSFSDSRRFSIGARGLRGTRNAPALINRGYGRSFFWDGRSSTLDEQVLHPISDTLEMNLPIPEMLVRLSRDRTLRNAYRATFRDGVTASNTARALASYIRTLRSGGTPVDRYKSGGTLALAYGARRGMDLFMGKAGCANCHSGPDFTDELLHNTGIAVGTLDHGRRAITGDSADEGAFKTPTLRDLEHTGPYMHDGSMPTLEDVVEHYNKGGVPDPNLDGDIKPLHLTRQEKLDLLGFLRSLSRE